MTDQGIAVRTAAIQIAEMLKDAVIKERPEQLKWLEDWLRSNEDLVASQFAQVTKSAMGNLRNRRRTLILRLANMEPDSAPVQRIMSSFKPEWHGWTAAMQKTLQLLWPREIRVLQKQMYVDLIMKLLIGRPDSQVYAALPLGYLGFAADNLPGQIVQAVLENWTRTAKCANPECPAPYFLAARSTQRYCERGECTKYAVRKKALKYWHKRHGKTKGEGE